MTARDYSGAFDTFDLTVGTGSAPTFTTSATLPPATEDAAYTTTITASDNDGNVPLVFAPVDLLPTWLELVAATGTTATLRSTTPPGFRATSATPLDRDPCDRQRRAVHDPDLHARGDERQRQTERHDDDAAERHAGSGLQRDGDG